MSRIHGSNGEVNSVFVGLRKVSGLYTRPAKSQSKIVQFYSSTKVTPLTSISSRARMSRMKIIILYDNSWNVELCA